MDSVNRILNHGLYIECLARNEKEERNRIFCRHDMEHLLAVARLAAIFNLQEGLGIERIEIYGAALLHDIGRYAQYRDNVPHERAGAELAVRILPDCGYERCQTARIAEAISQHRKEAGDASPLARLLFRADKMSRSCFACAARGQCNWEKKEKNAELRW